MLEKESLFSKPEAPTEKGERQGEISLREKIESFEELEDKEIPLDKKIETIKHFIESSSEEKLLFGIEDEGIDESLETRKRKIKKGIRNKSLVELKEDLGEQIDLIWRTISIHKKEINKETEQDIQQLIEKRGEEMIPARIRKILQLPGHILEYLSYQQEIKNLEEDKEYREEVATMIATMIRRELKEIEEDIFPERKKREPIKIKEFESFDYFNDYFNIEGEELIEKAIEVIPKELLGKNIQTIRYSDKEKPMPKRLGIKGNMTAQYCPSEKEIVFFKTDTLKNISIKDFPSIMAHEAGHALDPRFIAQEKLSLSEEMEMIKEWEEVRDKEPEFSSYARSIKNENKKIENCDKSIEDFAETIMVFLICPGYLEGDYPKRFEFCKKWLERQFPEENFTEIKKMEEWEFYLRSSNFQFQYDNLLKKGRGGIKRET